MNPRTSKTHVYLPGLAAHDTSHGRAAFEEMNKAGVSAGSIFVDTAEAQTVMRTRYAEHIAARMTAPGLSVRQRISLREQQRNAHDAVKVVNHQVRAAPGNNGLENGPADVLWVKGHGSATNPNSISTRVEYQVDQGQVQDGPTQRTLTVRRGYRQTHTADQVATSIRHISAMLKPNTAMEDAAPAHAMDVRISSCGSAGTFRRDPVGGVVPATPPNFAQSVSNSLDTQGANPRIRVSGFIGDSNSSHPSAGGVFTTKLKQRTDQAAPTNAFAYAHTRMQAKAGVAPNLRTVPIKRRVNPNAIAAHPLGAPIQGFMNTLAPRLPKRPTISAALRATAQPFTKIELTAAAERKPAATVPRASARVPIARGN